MGILIFVTTFRSNLAILLWYYFRNFHFVISTIFNKKRHTKHITKAEKYPMEFHNVTSHIGRSVGSFDFVTKCDREWAGSKKA